MVKQIAQYYLATRELELKLEFDHKTWAPSTINMPAMPFFLSGLLQVIRKTIYMEHTLEMLNTCMILVAICIRRKGITEYPFFKEL